MLFRSPPPHRLSAMYKHVAKQRKLTDSNKEARLSDEEASDDSSSDDAGSDSEANDSDSAFGDEDDDGIALPATGASDDDEDAEDEVELKEPPKGFPSALEALANPIAEPESVEGAAEGEEIQPVCVVCPSKALKRGKMLEIHLASKVRPSGGCWNGGALELNLRRVSGPQAATHSLHGACQGRRIP